MSPATSGASFLWQHFDCNPSPVSLVQLHENHLRRGIPMKFSSLAAAIACTLATLSISQMSFAGSGRDISSVNGSVNASPGESYDTLSAVNGDVNVGRGASANEARTVNGDVTLDADTKVGSASTVNGRLRIRDGASVATQASTVNGTIELGKRASVGGDVSTVSGDIELNGAEVTGGLETRNGDIDLLDGARVHGGIHIKRKNDNHWGDDDHRPVKVRICSTCVVDGELRFDREVELDVEPGAKIGKVIGDKVTRR
jgi:predicted acyltransferase (DUF342 family)